MSEALVDIQFPVKGETLPWDHSYVLFAALCQHQPLFHESAYPLGVFRINGTSAGERTLGMTHASTLRLRLPLERAVDIFPLLGATLTLDGHQVTLGSPTQHPIVPAPALVAPWVTYKGALNGETLLGNANRELEAKGIAGEASLMTPARARTDGVAIRRTTRIGSASVVGYAVQVRGLSAADSLKLCSLGLGGRRHFGGGLFLPARA